jgi:hemerythrin-like domain-containing protein
MQEESNTRRDPAAEHCHLEQLVDRFASAVAQQQPLAQQQFIFKLLKSDFIHHMKWEEAVLFSLHDSIVGLRSGPTRMLRAEHAEMELMIRALEKEQNDHYELALVNEFAQFMKDHARKELSILYPVIGDQMKLKKQGLDYRQAIA